LLTLSEFFQEFCIALHHPGQQGTLLSLRDSHVGGVVLHKAARATYFITPDGADKNDFVGNINRGNLFPFPCKY